MELVSIPFIFLLCPNCYYYCQFPLFIKFRYLVIYIFSYKIGMPDTFTCQLNCCFESSAWFCFNCRNPCLFWCQGIFNVPVLNSSCEKVKPFKYSYSDFLLTHENYIYKEIKNWLKVGNSCCYSVQDTFVFSTSLWEFEN